jgi:pyruvate,orthophosphate dikinase
LEIRNLIRQFIARVPLNPFQLAGLDAVLRAGAINPGNAVSITFDPQETTLTMLDRCGGEASPFLVSCRIQGDRVVVGPTFGADALRALLFLSPFKGRRAAIEENLLPVLTDIPHWLDLVRTLDRYILERDDDAPEGRVREAASIITAYLFAATKQPFDREARAEGEYVLCRFVESVFKDASAKAIDDYRTSLDAALPFLADELFSVPLNPFERRLIEATGVKRALEARSDSIASDFSPLVERLFLSALGAAFAEIRPAPAEVLHALRDVVGREDFEGKDRFMREVYAPVAQYSPEEIDLRKSALERASAEGRSSADAIAEGVAYVRGFGERWREIVARFNESATEWPRSVQEAFASVLARQILVIEKEPVKELLIQGLCETVVRLETARKGASENLLNESAQFFLDRAWSDAPPSEKVAALRALEALGVTLGRRGYSLMAKEFVDRLTRVPLLPPLEKKYTIEDDDTGEPLVIAEDTAGAALHVRHIKTLLTLIAANPRMMRRLAPYLVIQTELGGVRLCDEDLIQYSISCLLRANSPITHFLVRAVIKALPYSFKDIGPLDNLRLTAAGLAKELSDRGVKPIGNFLGKLRGDIHWRGSVENFYFCESILLYFYSGDPQTLAEWMPAESAPYLGMDKWASHEEAEGIRALTRRIFSDCGVDPSKRETVAGVMWRDVAPYREDDAFPEFSRRVVLDVVDLLKGLHQKYFVTARAMGAASVEDDLERLERIIAERLEIKEQFLTPDLSDPLPPPVTLTEGTDEYLKAIERIHAENPATPIVLRAKKAGHAYAQRASYLEERFEAFNKDLTLEALQETYATSVSNTHFDQITLENLPLALRFLDCLAQGVSVNGHSSYYLQEAAKDLRFAGPLKLTFDKVRDLIKVIKKELDDVHDSYRNWFEEPFDFKVGSTGIGRLPRKLKALTTLKEAPDTDFFNNYLKTLYISDLQARDGNLRVLEGFVDKVELFLNERLAESRRLVVPEADVVGPSHTFYFPDQGYVSSVVIGLKAALLRFAEATPPYFVITAERPESSFASLEEDRAFVEGLKTAVSELERQRGRALGDPDNPALFSIRSGARVSMPGMMITITNVGINDEIAESLAKKVSPWFAYDCYRRFLQEFGQSVYGLDREEFQDIIDERKRRCGVSLKAQMTGEQMKRLAFDYKARLGELAPRAVELLDQGRFLDVMVQCARVVLNSHEAGAARKFREAAGIAGNWRTHAIVQIMVYGNLELDRSGTGVTAYNPFTMDLRGDFAPGNQGTDVVGGKVAVIPVDAPRGVEDSLALRVPDAWKRLRSMVAHAAETLHLSISVEYTIERGKVFILQIRKNRETLERAPSLENAGRHVIARGVGVSGQVFRGIMVTDRNQIAPFRHINKAQSIIDAMNKKLPEGDKLDGFIFVVNDPIPEEIMEEVFSAPVPTALVSRLGGRGAHAADIAKSLGKVYVGQVRSIVKFSGKPETVGFGAVNVVVGSKMIIHGQTGEVALYGKPTGSGGA